MKKLNESKEKKLFAWSRFQQSPDPSCLPNPYLYLKIKKMKKPNDKNKST